MPIRVEEYVRIDGSNPYKSWFDKLEAQTATKMVTAKFRMEQGNTSNVKWFDGIDHAKALHGEYKGRKKAQSMVNRLSKQKRK